MPARVGTYRYFPKKNGTRVKRSGFAFLLSPNRYSTAQLWSKSCIILAVEHRLVKLRAVWYFSRLWDFIESLASRPACSTAIKIVLHHIRFRLGKDYGDITDHDEYQ